MVMRFSKDKVRMASNKLNGEGAAGLDGFPMFFFSEF